MEHIALGMKRDRALSIMGMTPHQYYYKPGKAKRGVKPTDKVVRHRQGCKTTCSNATVVDQMQVIQSDDDLRCGHRRMTAQLQLMGYAINHKKVYRLMKKHDLLILKQKSKAKNYVKYRIVSPTVPLSHLEMDIKFIWVEQYRKHALTLSVMDIFTRRILNWHVGMSITQHTVRRVFEQVIVDHLQENDMLCKGIHVEIRNDNDKRFSADMVQQFFEENYLNQVFTHPYTPEENGHIESFHKTLSQALKNQHFETLEQLEARLSIFYNNYNNQRSHGSLCGLTPYLFNQQWHKGNIERLELSNRKVKFRLLIPKYQLSGNESLREASCSNYSSLDGMDHLQQIKANGAIAIQPSVQRSPSVASC
jgi:transposase InsO family protein